MKNDKIKYYFEKLKEAHALFDRLSNQKQGELLSAFDWIFIELEKLNIPRSFSESLLIWGKDFVGSLSVPHPATIEEAEKIFEAKAEPLTEKETRELALAEKYNALIWKSRKSVDPTKVSIEVLVEEKKVTVPPAFQGVTPELFQPVSKLDKKKVSLFELTGGVCPKCGVKIHKPRVFAGHLGRHGLEESQNLSESEARKWIEHFKEESGRNT